jgi:DNA mismatch repair protein MutS
MAELTPMMQQYAGGNITKAQNPDCLLFFRLGDFYEMFDEDAKVASKELELALTTRDRGKPEEEQTPMCGVPYHSAEAYIARLIQKGYKVAICEQMEDPALAKGLVDRDIIRIITPGTVTESSMLEEGNQTISAPCIWTPASGGRGLLRRLHRRILRHGLRRRGRRGHIINELGRFSPSEAGAVPGRGGKRRTSPDFLRKSSPPCRSTAATALNTWPPRPGCASSFPPPTWTRWAWGSCPRRCAPAARF